MVKSKIFLDSSLLISATLSSTGGSFYILTSPKLNELIDLYINEYVLEESTRVIKTKFKNRHGIVSNFFLLLGVSNLTILPNPPRKDVAALSKVINMDDAPILASALEHCTYLLTLDKDFLGGQTIDYADRNNLFIMSPKDFILLWS